MAEEDVLVLKILLVGDPGCGKTSLIRRYVDNSFTGSEQPTIGMDFSLKEVVLAGQRVKVQLWDIGGQDHSAANLSRVYFRGSVGAFIVYDISRPSTFDGATTWKEALDERVTLPNGKPLPVILIGNKKDLEPSLAQVDNEYMARYTKEKGFIGWKDTNAKDEEDPDFGLALMWLLEHALDHVNIFGKRVGGSSAARLGGGNKGGGGKAGEDGEEDMIWLNGSSASASHSFTEDCCS